MSIHYRYGQVILSYSFNIPIQETRQNICRGMCPIGFELLSPLILMIINGNISN